MKRAANEQAVVRANGSSPAITVVAKVDLLAIYLAWFQKRGAR